MVRSSPVLVQIRLGQLVTRVAIAELAPYEGGDDEPAARKSASQALLDKCVLSRMPLSRSLPSLFQCR